MERSIILKNTNSGEELTLPVTPDKYPVAAGRTVERLDMAQTGQISLPGLTTLFAEKLEFMLPSKKYPFCTAGAVTTPSYYTDKLTAWSTAGVVCRYIVVGTGVNYPVLLGPLAWREEDGSNDIYCTLPLYEYRYLDEAQVKQSTGNKGRSAENSGQATPDSYTVVSGDSLWSICKKIYGDGSLAYKLATANGITNPNLIYPGQVLTLPDAATLGATSAVSADLSAAKETTVAAANHARMQLGLSPNAEMVGAM